MPIWLDDILGKDLAIDGGTELIPRRKTLEIIGDGGVNLVLVDDPIARRTKLTIDGSGIEGGGGDGGSTLAAKEPVRAASTANISNLGAASVSMDGVTLVEGDRVLLKNQSTASQNGIYVVGAVGGGVAPLTRAEDTDASSEWTAGTSVYVQEGTANAQRTYYLTTTGAITLGTTSLTFAVANTLARVLLAGNTTSGTSPTISVGDSLRFDDTTDVARLRSGDGYVLVDREGGGGAGFILSDGGMVGAVIGDTDQTTVASFVGDLWLWHGDGEGVSIRDNTGEYAGVTLLDLGGQTVVYGAVADRITSALGAVFLVTAPTTGIAGKNVGIIAGQGGTGNQAGGIAYLRAGSGTGSGAHGSVQLQDAAGSAVVTVSAARTLLAASSTLDWASGTASLRIGTTPWLTSTTSLASFAQPISVTSGGATVAGSGRIRTDANTTVLVARDQSNTVDMPVITVGANIGIGGSTANALVVLNGATGQNFDVAGTNAMRVRGGTIEFRPGAVDIAAIVSTGLNFASAMRANFLGEIDISRQGNQRLGSTGLNNVYGVPATGQHQFSIDGSATIIFRRAEPATTPSTGVAHIWVDATTGELKCMTANGVTSLAA
jgi:hypothetical protein